MGLDGDEDIDGAEGKLVVASRHATFQLPKTARGGKNPDVDRPWLLQPDEQAVEPIAINYKCHMCFLSTDLIY